jgi:hypothetical protein
MSKILTAIYFINKFATWGITKMDIFALNFYNEKFTNKKRS